MKVDLAQYEKIQPVTKLEFNGRTIAYGVPNQMALCKVKKLQQKREHTLEWLLDMKEGSYFLDIGANIGLYSIYAAVARHCHVTAFEPEAQNYSQINRNIFFNQMQDQIKAYCVALSDEIKLDHLYLSKFDYHGAEGHHSFGETIDFDLMSDSRYFTQGSISITLDWAVTNGMIDVPDYIKISVGGIERKVIAGAYKLLCNPKVKQLLIETNPHDKANVALIKDLESLGYYFDQAQSANATNEEASFANSSVIIFRRVTNILRIRHEFTPTFDGEEILESNTDSGQVVLDHILRRVSETPVNMTLFPHMVIDNFFPTEYFRETLKHFPEDAVLTPLNETGRIKGNAYKDRLVALFNNEHFAHLEPKDRKFWVLFADWLYSERFINCFVQKFAPHIAGRLAGLIKNGEIAVHSDALIVSDKTNYAIGPHTDAKHRLITFLFYLPEDTSQRDLGTSLYRPVDPAFECADGLHYPFDNFERVSTIEFLPNRAVVFARGNKSFHGVEPITRDNVVRHLIINNIRIVYP